MAAGALAALFAGSGCASSGGAVAGSAPASLPRGAADRASAGGPEIGLRRGGAWSTLTIRPPHIIGPSANLILKDGVLSGAMAGAHLHVRISEGGAEGYAPTGSVALDFRPVMGGLDVTGTWNGYHVHLTFTDGAVGGTVVNGGTSMTLDPRSQSGSQMLGNPSGPGVASYATCQYVLEERGGEGTLDGFSTCAGMPEQTRLEVPRIVRAYLTRPELVVVLVALLAAPPTSRFELIGG